MTNMLVYFLFISLTLFMARCHSYERGLAGTWTSKSKSVFTGSGFYDHVRDVMFPPKLTGVSYSFTDDGYFEESLYRVSSNPTTPECSVAVMQWQHGSYQKLDNGSLLLIPIPSDGRQIFSDPCASLTSRYTRFSVKELIIKYEVIFDPYYKEYKLLLYQFDGTPVQPLYFVHYPPRMLPTTTLTPHSVRILQKRSFIFHSSSFLLPITDYFCWVGILMIFLGTLGYYIF
ncbi:hypothetical protein T552_04198 [Pneumocystis carinii B80]|uniref:Protein ROT1 n=1 Tax=Pneumocystis carinii (strain B80) TaxID=1408658 RepID=A0A0W4ZCV8_PNEC8|nr:hypothetical protein T552_04198 [Pneumocystis carinii B80]KTW26161.1 hypothetical protein T552_04198 [Pneumocystis carinii B80]